MMQLLDLLGRRLGSFDAAYPERAVACFALWPRSVGRFENALDETVTNYCGSFVIYFSDYFLLKT